MAAIFVLEFSQKGLKFLSSCMWRAETTDFQIFIHNYNPTYGRVRKQLVHDAACERDPGPYIIYVRVWAEISLTRETFF